MAPLPPHLMFLDATILKPINIFMNVNFATYPIPLPGDEGLTRYRPHLLHASRETLKVYLDLDTMCPDTSSLLILLLQAAMRLFAEESLQPLVPTERWLRRNIFWALHSASRYFGIM
ncbi:hypothetical protein BO94DRAFT_583636 [Aspergillus sclerotioniger CBS 115572]|uniref:Uncharacterized protein n=1 Tax=Aspergillus sclerotioniger CBS 115572 TaxID=1450535 RepID=A0A317X571_9EURO|nr:hypothetical protein BO94DRAFT_583636 [Aspergillus sclerotioniger CBS 115572]PWY91700.1 hypothetical protein BO94DRAFT_583636 [Aspergillus sclerotioniger CBS 115572]